MSVVPLTLRSKQKLMSSQSWPIFCDLPVVKRKQQTVGSSRCWNFSSSEKLTPKRVPFGWWLRWRFFEEACLGPWIGQL